MKKHAFATLMTLALFGAVSSANVDAMDAHGQAQIDKAKGECEAIAENAMLAVARKVDGRGLYSEIQSVRVGDDGDFVCSAMVRATVDGVTHEATWKISGKIGNLAATHIEGHLGGIAVDAVNTQGAHQ